MNWNDLRLRIRALRWRQHAENDLDEELQFHIAMQTRKNLASGMEAPEAARRARIQFGGVEQIREECRTARGTQLVESCAADMRYALRSFRRAPSFVLTMISTIALGLGLNTAVFTIFNAYVLRPLAVRDPYSLYKLSWTSPSGSSSGFSWREFDSLRKENPAYSEVMGAHFLFARVEGHPLMGELVTGNYFRMLGVSAAHGRILVPTDAAVPGGDPVVVLSYTAWQKKFGGDPGIVGKKLVIHGRSLEVIGIAKPEFAGLSEVPRDFWAPITMAGELAGEPDLFGPLQPQRVEVVGRLRHGITARQAASAFSSWLRRITTEPADKDKPTGAVLESQATAVRISPDFLQFFSVIVVAFGLILLIACANVANLMLARAMARGREIGVRLSLGAGRGRLVRQLLTESIMLAFPAAAVGFALSQITIQLGQRAMYATMPADYAEYITVVPLPPDIRVFVFMVLAALFSAVVFGLAPAIQATRTNVMQAAKGDFTSDFRPARLRNALVIGQIAVSALLLICAGVLLRGARRMDLTDPGFRSRGIVELEFQEKFRSRIIAKLDAEPLVQTAAAVSSPPLNGRPPGTQVITGDHSSTSSVWFNFASPEYFQVAGIRLLRGRVFTQDEARAGASVAIVSQTTAQKLWPNQDALGQAIRLADPSANEARLKRFPAVRVIGVAADVVTCCMVIGKDPSMMYLPTNAGEAGNVLLLHVRGDDQAARRKVEADLATISSSAIDQIHTFQEFRAVAVYPFHVMGWIASTLGGLALLLTLSGVYGVLSYLVSQRTREIGIRVALGATMAGITALFVKQSLKLSAVGIGTGGLLAIVASFIFGSVFLGMNTFDAFAYGAGMLVVMAASIAAAWFPCRRAARIDPTTTLRYD